MGQDTQFVMTNRKRPSRNPAAQRDASANLPAKAGARVYMERFCVHED